MTEQEMIIKLMNEHKSPLGYACPVNEFKEDVMRLVYVGRLLKRRRNTGNLNVRLLLNHLTILYNVFTVHTTGLLFLMVEEQHHPELYAILNFMGRVPDNHIVYYFGNSIDINGVEEDTTIIKEIEEDINV